jgi:hypothetical protein
MAAGANPMGGQLLRMLQGGGGGPMGQPGAAPGAQANPQQGGAPDAYAQQVAELKGADPGGLLKQVKAIKQILAIMLVQNLERLPNVSGKIAKVIPQMDGIIKEIQQASNVNAAVRNPINMTAAQPGPEGAGGGGQMSTGGGF